MLHRTLISLFLILFVSSAYVKAQCPRGHFYDAESEICEKCPYGYGNLYTQDSCSACLEKANYYYDTTVEDCESCEYGYILNSNATGCVLCPRGSFYERTSETNLGTCTPCPTGYISVDERMWCEECPEDTYVNTTTLRCSQCPANFLGSVTRSECVPESRGESSSTDEPPHNSASKKDDLESILMYIAISLLFFVFLMTVVY